VGVEVAVTVSDIVPELEAVSLVLGVELPEGVTL
jgi:hypothetical protein